MDDDLVRRLRKEENSFYGTHPCGLLHEAANRIEQLGNDIVKYSGVVVELRMDNESLKRNFDRAIDVLTNQKIRIEHLEAALRKIADIEHEDLPKPSGAAEGTLWAILAGCVEVAEAALEGKDD